MPPWRSREPMLAWRDERRAFLPEQEQSSEAGCLLVAFTLAEANAAHATRECPEGQMPRKWLGLDYSRCESRSNSMTRSLTRLNDSGRRAPMSRTIRLPLAVNSFPGLA